MMLNTFRTIGTVIVTTPKLPHFPLPSSETHFNYSVTELSILGCTELLLLFTAQLYNYLIVCHISVSVYLAVIDLRNNLIWLFCKRYLKDRKKTQWCGLIKS